MRKRKQRLSKKTAQTSADLCSTHFYSHFPCTPFPPHKRPQLLEDNFYRQTLSRFGMQSLWSSIFGFVFLFRFQFQSLCIAFWQIFLPLKFYSYSFLHF